MDNGLQGLRVLDLTRGQAMIGGQMLARLGADVVQVEPPAGSATRSATAPLWTAFATGKRGISCNLESPQGRALLAKLALIADVLIHDESAAVMKACGLSWAQLQPTHSRLMHVSISPFGETGPKSGYEATDLIVWAAGGALWPSRDGERPPLRISSDQAFLHAGADAAVGALAALAAREQTGRGQQVTVAAVESVAQATLSSVLAAQVGHADFSLVGGAQAKAGSRKQLDLSGSGARTRRSKWVVKDGLVELHLAMGPAAGRFTNNLFAWLRSIDACDQRFAGWDWARALPQMIEQGEVTDDDLEHARAQVAAAFSRFTRAELLEVSMKHRVLLAPVMSVADLATNWHLHERQAFVDVVGVNGERQRMPAPVTGTASPRAALRPAPAIGEHNGEVYSEIGLDTTRLAQLKQQGVI